MMLGIKFNIFVLIVIFFFSKNIKKTPERISQILMGVKKKFALQSFAEKHSMPRKKLLMKLKKFFFIE